MRMVLEMLERYSLTSTLGYSLGTLDNDVSLQSTVEYSHPSVEYVTYRISIPLTPEFVLKQNGKQSIAQFRVLLPIWLSSLWLRLIGVSVKKGSEVIVWDSCMTQSTMKSEKITFEQPSP